MLYVCPYRQHSLNQILRAFIVSRTFLLHVRSEIFKIMTQPSFLKPGILGPFPIPLRKILATVQVDMSAQLAKVLGQVVLDRKEQLLRLGMSIDELPNLWLFQNTAGEPMDDSKVRKVFSKLLAKAGLAQRNLHFLRHTFASLLLQQGESLKYVQDQLGHSSIKMTCDTYGHLVPGGNRQAVDRLDDGNKMETFWNKDSRSVPQLIEKAGATRRIRTADLLITNQLLYRLS